MSIAFRDHEGFQRAALSMTCWGAAAGLAAHALAGSSAALLGGSIGAVLGAGMTPSEGEGRRARIGVGLVLVSASTAAAMQIPGWTGLAALALAVAIALQIGAPRRRWLVGIVVGGAVMLAALRTGLQIASAQELAAWPRWIVSMAGAAATSLVAMAALLPRHVRIERDPVAAAVATLPSGLDGEVRDLVERGRGVWSEVRALRSADPANLDLVRDGVLRLVEVAGRSADVSIDLSASAERIAARVAELDARIAAASGASHPPCAVTGEPAVCNGASDEVAAAQYRQARALLDDQQRDLDAIRAGRERLIARMHHHLAGVERFRLAVIKHHASAPFDSLARDEGDEPVVR